MRNLLFLLAFTFSNNIYAQFIGEVVDSKKLPIAYANVCLLSEDSVFIAGCATDEQGKFSFAETPASAFLRISCVGYQNLYEKLDARKHQYVLSPLDMNLDEVVVTAHKKAIKIQGTNLIADVEHSLFRDFGTANDILDKIPMVYGKDGNYSVFGKGSAVVYINRRKVTDLSELSRLDSKDIASIEVLRNPGIAYDADVNAVIKINLKRNFIEGWGVRASVKDEQGRRNSDNEQVQVTYGNRRVNAFATFTNSSARMSTDQQNVELIDTDERLWQLQTDMNDWDSNYYNQNITGGLSVYLSDRHTVGGQFSYSKETDRSEGVSSSRVMADRTEFEQLYSVMNSNSNYNQWNTNLYYEGKLSDKLTLNFNGDMLRRKANDHGINSESGTLTEQHEVTSRNQNRYGIYAGLLTMDYAFNKSMSFSWGTNISFVENKLHNQTFDEEQAYNLSGLHSEETKYAFFAEGGYGNKAFSARLGVRYEVFKMLYTDDLAHATLEDRTYNRFYPYVSCSYSGKDVRMGVSLSTKVRRPSYYQLRNSTEYLNRYTMSEGNPMLLPQYTTSLSYMAQYRGFTFSLDYEWVDDYMMSSNIVKQTEPLVSVSKPVNLPNYTALNASLAYNTKIGVWEPYLSANMTRTFLDIYDENHVRMNGTRPYVMASFNNYWELKNDWMPYLTLGYNNDGYLREYRVKQSFLVGLGLVKRLLDKKLYIRLSVDNLLGTKEREVRYDMNYIFSKEKFRDNQRIGLYVRYSFNNKKKYKGKSAAGEEINRM